MDFFFNLTDFGFQKPIYSICKGIRDVWLKYLLSGIKVTVNFIAKKNYFGVSGLTS